MRGIWSLGALIIVALSAGIVFFAYERRLIILYPLMRSAHDKDLYASLGTNMRQYTLYTWQQHEWREQTVMRPHEQTSEKILTHLIQAWLEAAHDAQLINQNVQLQAVTLSFDKTMILIAFTHNFLSEKYSIFYKWKLVESLLKTIKNSALSNAQTVMIFVHNKPLVDAHIDFDFPLVL